MIWEHLPKGERLFSEPTRFDVIAAIAVIGFVVVAFFAT